MNPFYDLNKRLTGIGAEQKRTVTESKAVAVKSPAKQTFEEALRTDLRSLMEDGTGGAYGSNTLEAKDKSLSKAAKTVKKGALHKQEGIPKDEKIGDKKLNSLKKSGTPLEKKRANFALNIQGKGKKKVNEWGHDPRELSDPNSIWHQGGGGDYDRDPDDQHAELVDAWYSEVEQAVKHRGIEFPISEEAIGELTDIIAMDLDCSASVVEDIIVSMNDRHMHDNRHGNIDEADRGFRGVGGARDREDDEHHHLDNHNSTEKKKFYKVKEDGKLYEKSVSPQNINAAYGDGWLPKKSLALAKGGQQGVAESDPLANRDEYAKQHQQGQVYKTHYPKGENPFHKAGMKDKRSTKMSAYDISNTGPKGQLPESGVAEGEAEYEGYEGCAECAMGECDMHGEQPKDMNPGNKDWDDAAIARLRAQKNQRTAKRRVGQRDTGQPPVMPDLDETHDYNELKDIYMWTERHGMPTWKLVARNVRGQSVGHAIDRLCGKHFDTDPDDYEVVASGSKPKSLSESEDDMLSYLKNKIAPPNTKSRATSRPYNGRSGAADAHNGMEFEGSMFPGSDEYDSKFGKPTADLDSAFSRGSSPAGGTVYTRKRKEVPFDSDEVEKPVASSDGPRKRGRPAGSKGGGGARLAGTHVPKHARSKEMDEDLDECPNCGQSMPGHGRGREIDLEAAKQGMGHFVNNVAPAARKAAGIAKVVSGAKAKKDYDGDGKIESGKDEHAGSVDKAIKANKSKSPAKPAAPAKGSDKPTKKAKAGDKPAKKTEEGKGDGNLANNAKPYDKVTRGDVVAGRLGKDEEGGKKKDKKEKKVEETTTGSVATSSGGKSSGGMSVGKGIYDSWNRKYNTMLSESINITTNSVKGDTGEEDEHITIDVSGDDVARIKELLHSMGVGSDDGAEHMHGSHGMPSDFIEIDEAVGEEETPKPSAPVPPGPNGPWEAGSPQAQAYSKMSPADQKFLGHANPLDPAILARAPNRGKPVVNAQAQAQAMASAADGVNQGPRGQTAAPAAAAKPAAPAAAGGLLAVGSKGPEVAALQKLLDIAADGDFGPATKAAVMAKQKELKVAVDGVWGPESKAAMSAQAGRVNGQNVSPEHQGRPAPAAPAAPAAKSQADKIARFKELLAQARKRPDSISAATASDPNYNPGTYPGNPSTPPAPAASAAPFNAATPQGFDESISHFLNKMRLLEDLSAEEKKEIEALYKELGNTEQPDPELSSLLNQYNGLFPTGSTASSGADQAGASADAADADAGAAMQVGANRAAFNQSVQDTENSYNDTSNAQQAAAIQGVQDTEDAYPSQSDSDMADATANAADGPSTGSSGVPLQPISGQTGVAAIPPNADKTKPFWVNGVRYEWQNPLGGRSGATEWKVTKSAFPSYTNRVRSKFSGAQLDELAQHNSENQRLRELAGIAEAVAPVTKNAPDYPTNQVKADTRMMTQNLSGGLNGAKTTGQTTTPVVASQVNRLHSQVSEGERMMDLYKTIARIENKEV